MRTDDRLHAYIDGELCGVLPDGRTAFNLIQNATDTGQGSLVFFLFDLLHLDGENLTALPLVDRKTRLASLLKGAPDSLRNPPQPDHRFPRSSRSESSLWHLLPHGVRRDPASQ